MATAMGSAWARKRRDDDGHDDAAHHDRPDQRRRRRGHYDDRGTARQRHDGRRQRRDGRAPGVIAETGAESLLAPAALLLAAGLALRRRPPNLRQ